MAGPGPSTSGGKRPTTPGRMTRLAALLGKRHSNGGILSEAKELDDSGYSSAGEQPNQQTGNEKAETSKSGKWFPKKTERHKSGGGRKGVLRLSLWNSHSSSSVTKYSRPTKIGGVFWRLRVTQNRNTLTGQFRFLSVAVLCERGLPSPGGHNLPLIAFITFHLVSRRPNWIGHQQQIVGLFDDFSRCAGISSFIDCAQVFVENSAYLGAPNAPGEARIECELRVRPSFASLAHQRLVKCRREQQSALAVAPTADVSPHQQQLLRRRSYFEEEAASDGEEGSGKGAEKENEVPRRPEDELMELLDEDLDAEERERAAKLLDKKRRAIKQMETKRGAKRRRRAKSALPSRRSCRISPKFLDSLRFQVLREQVQRAVNEPYLQVFRTHKLGRGLRALKQFRKGEFVVEYKGDVIDQWAAQEREKVYAKNADIGCYMFYFKHRDQRFCVDATQETEDKGRLINHSRLAPNLRAKVFDLGNAYPHLCLVALHEIVAGEELRFDYGDRTPLTVEKHPWLLNS